MKFIKKLNEGLGDFPAANNETALNDIDTTYKDGKAISGFGSKGGAVKKGPLAYKSSAEKFGNTISN